MADEKTGRIVWHDLFTPDIHASRDFYARVAGWHYVMEHATDFAWGGGEKDFVLALVGGEAGAGFVDQPQGRFDGWVSYVEVRDVDAASAQAKSLGGSVERPPFEVPGVGRNCLLRDPMGALIGICYSRHDYPVPTRQFGSEIFLTPTGEFPDDFYRKLFDWDVAPADEEADERRILCAGKRVATIRQAGRDTDVGAIWVPAIKVRDIGEARRDVRALNGSLFDELAPSGADTRPVLSKDPNGALSVLIVA